MTSARDRLLGLTPAEQERLRVLLLERQKRSSPPVPIATLPSGAPGPLSFAEERIWFLERLDPESPVHRVGGHFLVDGPLHEGSLARALDDLVRKHERLATRYVSRGGRPQLVSETNPTCPLVIHDLTGYPPTSREPHARALAQELTVQPFDLEVNLPIRAGLVRLGPERHLLSLVIHHIAADGWSLGILLRDLGELYSHHRAGRSAPPPNVHLRYADYAAWQRASFARGAFEAGTAALTSALKGAPDRLELPTDRPRPPVLGWRSGHAELPLSEDTWQALTTLGIRSKATPFSVLLAMIQVLLARLSGQDAVVVGAPFAGRARSELEPLVGLFVNTLPLLGQVARGVPFSEVVSAASQAIALATTHIDVPFDRLVQALSPQRSRAHAPIFQVLLTLSTPHAPLTLDAAQVTELPFDTEALETDLALTIARRNGARSMTLRYARDLFDQDTMVRWLGHLQTLMASAFASPDAPIGRLALLSADERRRLLALGTGPTPSRPRLLPALLSETTRLHGPRAALRFGDRSLTYAALHGRVVHLARRLRQLGAGRGATVAVALARSDRLPLTLLAVLFAGAAYLPIEPTHPAHRIERVLAAARPTLVIVDDAPLSAPLPDGCRTVAWDTLDATEAAASNEPLAEVTETDLAYVIFTSGSTGAPKGVLVSHGALASLLAAMRTRPGLHATDTFVAVSNPTFDIAALELFLPWTVGASLVVAPSSTTGDATALARLVEQVEATVLQATPATWTGLCRVDLRRKGLRAWCGGEALSPGLARALVERFDEVWNLYGPTETTIWSSVERVSAAPGLVPLGQAIAGTFIHVVEPGGDLAPPGVPGEIVIGGAGLSEGYLDDPDRTRASFVDSPWGRIYRTGDRGLRTPAGDLTFLGRYDHQLKIRGFRVEPGEIEACLRTHSAVSDAVVVRREDVPGDARLVAYVTPGPGATADPQALRRHVSAELPSHFVPSAVVVLPAFPLTTAGKIDRAALPHPTSSISTTPSRANDETERSVMQVFRTVLGLTEVPRDASFFDLGGHSLLAIELFAELETRFQRSLPLATLFEAPTPAALSALLRQGTADPAWRSIAALQPAGDLPPFFCVHAAMGDLLFLRPFVQHLGPEQPIYGFQSPDLGGPTNRPSSVEAMAGGYVNDLLRLRPRGPYHLGGYSFGGLVAFEMAHQLNAKGHEVATLAVIDGNPPKPLSARSLLESPLDLWRRFVVEVGVAQVLHFRRNLRVYRARMRAGRPLSFFNDLERVRRAVAFVAKLSSRYVPRPYAGPLTLIAPIQRRSHDPATFWRPLASTIHFLETPGGHLSLMQEPHVEHLAALIREILVASDRG